MRIFVLLISLTSPPALAQCELDFVTTFWPAGFDGPCESAVVFDDGTGPALYVGGYFSTIGNRPVNRIAKWDGVNWTSLGRGLENADPIWSTGVRAMAVHDADGDGPEPAHLYVAGRFSYAGGEYARNVARWDGQRWTSLDSDIGGDVYALLSFDFDGKGPQPSQLVAAGDFYVAGDTDLYYGVAVWNGKSWFSLAEGIDAKINSLAAFDADGLGGQPPVLIAAGFAYPRPVIMRWTGEEWQSLSESFLNSGSVSALAAFDSDGSGPAPPRLLVGGRFTIDGTQAIRNLASWDGESWSPAGQPDDSVRHLYATAEAGQPVLLASGSFETVGGVSTGPVARWDGFEWSFVMPEAPNGALIYFDEVANDSTPPALYCLGTVSIDGGLRADEIARWDGVAWSALAAGTAPRGQIHAFKMFDSDGAGPIPAELYAAGGVRLADGSTRPTLERWDGVRWWSIPMDQNLRRWISALEIFDDGAGTALYAAGVFYRIDDPRAINLLRWDGTTWSVISDSPPGFIHSLTVHDDGTGVALYAGGEIAGEANGDPNEIITLVARWDGQRWSALGPGLTGNGVTALVSWDPDESGPLPARLIAAGSFSQAGLLSVSNVAAWDGAAWRRLGQGLPGMGWAATAFNDGNGNHLYVSGDSKPPAVGDGRRVARWDGATWLNITDTARSGPVAAFETFDEDGDGPLPAALYAGGARRWDGANWSYVSGTHGYTADAMCAFVQNGRPTLALSNQFDVATLARVGPFGDLDGNWSVNAEDLAVLITSFGSSLTAAPFEGDLDGDTDVDLDDLTLLLAAFGGGC